jgi:hypothetical protein
VGYIAVRGGDRHADDDEDIFTDAAAAALNGRAQSSRGNDSGPALQALLPPRMADHYQAWVQTDSDQIYRAFDASQPVDEPQDLRGRQEQLGQLMAGVLFRRTHGIVSGPRGSGKTSLVRVFAKYAEAEGVIVSYAACDPGSTFGEIMRDFLEQIPAYAVDPEVIELFAERVAHFGSDSTPHQAASIFSLIKYSQIVFVVDEFERVEGDEFSSKMASLLKLISDSRVPVRLVLVGGGGIFGHVVSDHQSLMRHVTRLITEPLSSAAIEEVLDTCAERCGMRFLPDAKKLLWQIVCGSPYHARLFGMHSALAAVANGHKDIHRRDVIEGLSQSFEEWAALNREDAAAFTAAIGGAKGNTDRLIEAARSLATPEPEAPPGKRSSLKGIDEQQVLNALAPAVERANGGIAFRDATAPQFLIALQHISSGSKRGRRVEGGARV